MEFLIDRVTTASFPDAVLLAARLWPEHSLEDLAEALGELLKRPDAALGLACMESRPVGFAQCQLRWDYVEGTSHSPVGYLEGVYVEPDCRRRGIAKQLLNTCEAWAGARGCLEFASDCGLENRESLGFHLGAGFAEANRIICFVKKEYIYKN